MTNQPFILQTEHNMKFRNWVSKRLMILIAASAILMLIAYIFWDAHTYTAYSLKTGKPVTAGWPNTLVTIGFWGTFSFTIFLLFYRFSVDSSKPALAVNEEGMYINQNFMRNNFVPWNLISAIENVGTETNAKLKISFTNPDKAVKNQFFLYRSISKSSVKQDVFRIEQRNNIGDLLPLYNYAKSKITA